MLQYKKETRLRELTEEKPVSGSPMLLMRLVIQVLSLEDVSQEQTSLSLGWILQASSGMIP